MGVWGLAPAFHAMVPQCIHRSSGRTTRGAILLVVPVLLASTIPAGMPPAGAADAMTLRVGEPEDMVTRNPLSAAAENQATSDVLRLVYGSVLLHDPTTDQPVAYVAKGVDVDQDGIFEGAEYDQWRKDAGVDPLNVTVYYDFNGVRWHDGTQVDVWDLLFSYHASAMSPRLGWDVRVLLCNATASYESCGRQLSVSPTSKGWEGEGAMAGNPALRVAVRFTLNGPYVRFFEDTLSPEILPMHEWSRTGGGRHGDFGCSIWIPPAEGAAKGLPECATTDSARWGRGVASTDIVPASKPYDFEAAASWSLGDADAIGSGPFRFGTWIPNVEARLVRSEAYFTGVDPGTGAVYDAHLAQVLRRPHITAIQFRVYKTTQLGLFALENGEIDFYHHNFPPFPPEFVPDLLRNPEIAVVSNPDLSFAYLGYNLRRLPWGYNLSNPADPWNDLGLPIRAAVAHLIDHRAIVQNLLQNFGSWAYGLISPANTFWYDDALPKPDYDPSAAAVILDSPQGRAAGIGADPAGPCGKETPGGCRSLAGLGTSPFEILVPEPGYDPILTSAERWIEDSLRAVGLNAVAKPTSLIQLRNLVQSRDYAMYMSVFRPGRDPDFLFSFLHCGDPTQPGDLFCDDDYSRVMADSEREMDAYARRALIFRAQEILSEKRPVEPLYFPANIEAYRQDRFVNWTVITGTIWNDWSLLRIHPPGTRTLRLAVDAPTVVASEGREAIAFTVRDASGLPVAGAFVAASISSTTGDDPGVLIAGMLTGHSVTLAADAGGRATVVYRAPLLYASTRPIALRAVASREEYEPSAAKEAILTVMGRDLRFLQIHIDLPLGDQTYPGMPLPVRIVVREPSVSLVPDADVDLLVLPDGVASPRNGTSGAMGPVTVVLPVAGTYTISANASKAGYVPGWGVATIWVVEPRERRPPPTAAPGDAGPIILAGVLGTALVAAVALAIWRRSWSRRGRRRPRA